jgi:hypothetical protein
MDFGLLTVVLPNCANSGEGERDGFGRLASCVVDRWSRTQQGNRLFQNVAIMMETIFGPFAGG